MVSLYKIDNIKNTKTGSLVQGELRGLSTDTKPSQIGNITIDNGSVYVEMDTQKLYFYDMASKEWIGE